MSKLHHDCFRIGKIFPEEKEKKNRHNFLCTLGNVRICKAMPLLKIKGGAQIDLCVDLTRKANECVLMKR